MDIIQAVGRAIRLSMDKTVGTIVLPVFIEDGEDTEERIEASNFQPVWWVLNALKAHDDALTDELDAIRTEMGNPTRLSCRKGGIPKVIVDLPTIAGKAFSEALVTKVVEHTTSAWYQNYGKLLAFYQLNNHCRVRRNYSDAPQLGKWVQNQRSFYKNDALSGERVTLLNQIDFVWSPYEVQWYENYDRLVEFKDQNGHCNVSTRSSETALSRWVTKQRVAWRSEKLNANQIELLKAIGFEFEREQRSRRGRFYLGINDAKGIVHPFGFISGREYTEWARGQRSDLAPFPNNLPRRPELQYKDAGWKGWPDFIGPTWSRPQDRYLSFIDAREFVRGLGLKTWADWFKYRKGEISGIPPKPSNIPAAAEHVYKKEWVSIYDWLGTSPVRVAQTDQIWREMHDLLVAYKEQYGDCSVPGKWSGNPKLANWVATQRTTKSKGKLSDDRISMLDDLGFVWQRQ